MDLNNLDKKDDLLNSELINKTNNNIIHLRIQQRNTRKYLTLIEGLKLDDKEYKIFLKKIKKKFSCNGSIIVKDNIIVIQLQGDQRETIKKYMIENNISQIENIKCHGF